MAAQPVTEMLILQPTPFCNLGCVYCYLPARDNRSRMSDEVLEATFSKLLVSSLVRHKLTVVWHAGEPLVLPPSWYHAAFAVAEAHRPQGLEVEYAFQSNGTLINEAWGKFFRQTGAKISLSIDGPAWLHNANRLSRNGGPTHAQAIRGLRALQDVGIQPAVITVLTRASLAHADALFEFYQDEGIVDVAFNVEELEGVHATTSLLGSDVERAFRAFLRTFICRMRREPDVLVLREFRNAWDVLRVGVAEGRNQEAEPLRIVSVAHNGAVSTFSPELLGMRDERYSDFLFGDICADPLEVIVERVMASPLWRDISAGIANCRRTCGWFTWCGGGAPSNKIFEAGHPSATETAYCRLTRQALLEVVIGILEDEALSGRIQQ
jgi:uncharacterized protein